MPPIEMGQVTSIPDFIQTDHFSFLLPVIPGGGDSEAFHIRNLTAVLPGKSNQIVSAVVHRIQINRAGRLVFPHQFQATYIDTPDSKIIQGLRNWQALNTDPETGLPNPSQLYMTTGMALIYGPDNKVIERREFQNLWVPNVADLSLGGDQSAAARFQVTFSYDAWFAR